MAPFSSSQIGVTAMLQRLKRPIYHCHRLVEGENGFQKGFDLFSPPVQRMINIRGINGELLIVTGGELDVRNLVAKIRGPCPYREGDRCYVAVAPPESHDSMCSKADYRIASVSRVHNTAEVVFEKAMGDGQNAHVQG